MNATLAHPSWYPKVLETLARDHPDISEEVWAKTITENAVRNNEKASSLSSSSTGDNT